MDLKNSYEPVNPALRLRNAIARVFTPPPTEMPSVWANREFTLSKEYANSKSKLTLWPFQEEPLDCFHWSHPCQEIVMMAGVQLLKSVIIQLAIAWVIYADPGPALMLLPREDDIERFTRDRVDPMVRDNAALAARVVESKSREKGNTVDKKSFEGGQIHFVAANSAQNVSSFTSRFGFADELDRCPMTLPPDGDLVQLFRNRFTAFTTQRKIIWSSSPTVKGRSNIEKRWKVSDQRQYHVPCPHCLHKQPLLWEHLQWGELDPTIVWYECQNPACQQPIENKHLWWMLQKENGAAWVAGNPKSNMPGFTISHLYHPDQEWKYLVAEWLQAEGKVDEERTFINTKLGRLYEENSDVPDWQILRKRAGGYELGEMPRQALLLTAGIDVQGDRIEVGMWGWDRRTRSWLVHYQVIPGNTALDEPWDNLTDYLNSPFRHPLGADVFASMIVLDCNYKQVQAYSWLRKIDQGRFAGKVMGIRGDVRSAGVFGRPFIADTRTNGRAVRSGVRIWPLNVSALKSELFGFLSLELEEQEEKPRGWIHLPVMDDYWYEQLTAECLMKKKSKSGYEEAVWVKTGPNEALDTRVYARAGHHRLGCDNWPEHRWDELERQLAVQQETFLFEAPRTEKTPPAVPSRAAGKPPIRVVKPVPAALVAQQAPRPSVIRREVSW
jgi:phage terminase large subunit GpA-like protein